MKNAFLTKKEFPQNALIVITKIKKEKKPCCVT